MHFFRWFIQYIAHERKNLEFVKSQVCYFYIRTTHLGVKIAYFEGLDFFQNKKFVL